MASPVVPNMRHDSLPEMGSRLFQKSVAVAFQVTSLTIRVIAHARRHVRRIQAEALQRALR